MRLLKWLLGIVVLLAAVVFIGGYLLPREVEVARSIEIDAPAAEVFPHVNSLKATETWSPWLSMDPQTTLTYNDVPEGVGAAMQWQSENPQVGSGSQEPLGVGIVESVENQRVVTALDFGEMGSATARFDLAENAGRTNVTWGLRADMGGGPVGRWMGLMMDRWVGADYERGLANLKALVER